MDQENGSTIIFAINDDENIFFYNEEDEERIEDLEKRFKSYLEELAGEVPN